LVGADVGVIVEVGEGDMIEVEVGMIFK